MKKMISLVIAVIATVSSAIAVPQTAAVDTTQAAKQAKKALKLMNKDNEKDWQKGFAMYRDAAYKGFLFVADSTCRGRCDGVCKDACR